MPDSPDLDRLAAAYRASLGARTAGGSHPSDDAWERLATGAASETERAALGDHVVACPECLAVYRVVMDVTTNAASLDPESVLSLPAPEPRVVSTTTPVPPAMAAAPHADPAAIRGPWLALAAALVAAVGTAIWAWALRGDVAQLESRIAGMRPASDVTRLEDAARRLEGQVSALTEALTDAREAGVNVPVVDLVGDTNRGGRASIATADVPPGARFVTLVLVLDGLPERSLPATIEIVRDDGTLVGRWPGARPGQYGAMSMVVPSARLPSGRYTVTALAAEGTVVRTFPLAVRQQAAGR